MKKLIYLIIFISINFYSCTSSKSINKSNTTVKSEKIAINEVLNSWHFAASEAHFENYFKYMANNSIFIGTDATENWNLADFKSFSKPYFDKGKAWSFTPLERSVFLNENHSIAWFDELLDTQMKICRGSGVMKKIDNEWKIIHYVLSMTIPNDHANQVIEIKKDDEESLIKKLQSLR